MIGLTNIQAQVYDAVLISVRQAVKEGAGLGDACVALEVVSAGIKADIAHAIRAAALVNKSKIVAAPPGFKVENLGSNGR